MPGWQASPTCRLQAFRRRSGCIPAEPYPPLKQNHIIRLQSTNNRSTSLFSFCSHVSPFAKSTCPLLLGTPVSFCSHRNRRKVALNPGTRTVKRCCGRIPFRTCTPEENSPGKDRTQRSYVLAANRERAQTTVQCDTAAHLLSYPSHDAGFPL